MATWTTAYVYAVNAEKMLIIGGVMFNLSRQQVGVQ